MFDVGTAGRGGHTSRRDNGDSYFSSAPPECSIRYCVLMPDLIAPTPNMEAEWRRAHEAWGPGSHEDGFGLLPTDSVATSAGFASWIARLRNDSAHCTYRWVVANGEVLGGIALRHGLTDFIQIAGHVGYGIKPSARGKGLATWALGEMLVEARKLGMKQVLLVCEADNRASVRTIENRCGVLESETTTRNRMVRRYWIDLEGHPACRDR